jgi:hypothetical protein
MGLDGVLAIPLRPDKTMMKTEIIFGAIILLIIPSALATVLTDRRILFLDSQRCFRAGCIWHVG